MSSAWLSLLIVSSRMNCVRTWRRELQEVTPLRHISLRRGELQPEAQRLIYGTTNRDQLFPVSEKNTMNLAVEPGSMTDVNVRRPYVVMGAFVSPNDKL